jgi:hypothetical protein
MAAYEVFEKSNAQYLFKTAKSTQQQYAIPSAFNKWFFLEIIVILDLSYNISNELYDRIKLNWLEFWIL